jgi:NADPH2:quinone reductase
MKALVCREHGLPDKLDLVDDWPEPEVGEHDVLIAIKAASLNFPDVLIIQGKYQFQPDLPFIPGGECAGEIVAVGSAVNRFKPGDKVISIGGAGCFCERIAANEFSVFPMPEGLSYEQAAGVAMTYFTSYYALKQRANLQPGETLLVLGAAGGVGSTAVELGKQMGAKVIAAASSSDKLELCRQLGADELINYSEVALKDAVKGAARDGLERSLPGDRLCQRAHSQHSTQPGSAQGLRHRRRILGTLHRRGAGGQRAERGRALGAFCPGQAQAGDYRNLFTG